MSLRKVRVVLVSVGVVPELMTMFERDSISQFVEVAGRWLQPCLSPSNLPCSDKVVGGT